jgi:hypothetical protein
MEQIDFRNRDNPDYEAQLNYLIQREFFVEYYGYRKFLYYLIGITLIIIGIFQFTSPDIFLTIKAIFFVMISLSWLITILFALSILFKWLKRRKWKLSSIEFSKNNDLNYKLSFDQEKILIEAPTYKMEFSWEYYSYWAENKNSIFIFPCSNLYDALYYSKSDLGEENYLEFKNIATTKLIRL